MNTLKMIFLPHEIVPCPEHGLGCGGTPKPRFDLPVFHKPADVVYWMIQPENTHVHMRDGLPVILNWFEHTPEEAVAMGFTIPQETVH